MTPRRPVVAAEGIVSGSAHRGLMSYLTLELLMMGFNLDIKSVPIENDAS